MIIIARPIRADMTEQLQPARWKGLPDDLSPCCLLVCLPPASVHFHAWRSRWRLLFVIEQSSILVIVIWIWIIWGVMVQRCLTYEQDLRVFLTGRLLSVVLWRGPSAAAADQVSIDSFIIERRWKMIPSCRPFGLWALLLSLLRDPLTFPTHKPGSSSELEGVCVCVPPSSAWGQMRLMESSPVGSGPTICCVAGPSVSAALAAFGLFSVWECERNLRWHAADRLTWESGAFLWGDRSICQVTMRLSHLENQPWVSHCPVYIIFICSVHTLTNLSEAGTSSLFTRLNY